jgi:hypothetical protein
VVGAKSAAVAYSGKGKNFWLLICPMTQGQGKKHGGITCCCRFIVLLFSTLAHDNNLSHLKTKPASQE